MYIFRKGSLLSFFPKGCVPTFFSTPKNRSFFICLFEQKCGERLRWKPSMLDGASCRSCPTCRKKAQDVSVKVSPSMYLSKSQKRNRVLPMNFPPRDRSDFFTPFGKRLSKITSPRVTRCLSFFCVFNLCFFYLQVIPNSRSIFRLSIPRYFVYIAV